MLLDFQPLGHKLFKKHGQQHGKEHINTEVQTWGVLELVSINFLLQLHIYVCDIINISLYMHINTHIPISLIKKIKINKKTIFCHLVVNYRCIQVYSMHIYVFKHLEAYFYIYMCVCMYIYTCFQTQLFLLYQVPTAENDLLPEQTNGNCHVFSNKW